MDVFSISQLEEFSGIKAHTIRIWEQRYNALKPGRSAGNTRYYDYFQLRRLLNIVSLLGLGYKISELSVLPDDTLFQMINDHFLKPQLDSPAEYFISQLILAGMGYDESHFEKVFSKCLTKLGMKETYLQIIYPVLERMGMMWASDSIPPAQEHFNSNLIRLKLSTAIDSLPPPNKGTETWMLFLPKNESHELGLLFAQYLIRSHGRKTIYLGGSLPIQSIVDAATHTGPDNLLLFLVHNHSTGETQAYLDVLSALFPDINLFVAGNSKLTGQINMEKTVWLKTVEELENRLL